MIERPFVLPQLGIFVQGTAVHHFLEFDLQPGVVAADAVAPSRRLRAPVVSSGGVNIVLGFAADIWRAVAPPEHAPLDLADFRAISPSDGHGAPATQHHAWVWISGAAPDVVWDHARAAALAVADVASLAAERAAFTYHDGRDMTGFVDGTANPPTRLAPHVAMVPPGSPGAGGCHVLVMRWVHDLAAFGRLTQADQEDVIGRTKPDSIELSASNKPRTAHIARVEVNDEQGREIETFPPQRAVRDGRRARPVLHRVQRRRARYDVLLARMFVTSATGSGIG